MPESNFFMQKSTFSIFRFEEVIFNVYPQMASLKRRGQTPKEIFLALDITKIAGIDTNTPSEVKREDAGSLLETIREAKDVESSK
jgi:hypothetical protein